MNTVNFNDSSFTSTKTYQNFIKDNPGSACLNIRASSANFAVPIDNVKIIVSKVIDNYNVIFYEGFTDESGMINLINLPTPSVNQNDLIVPASTSYIVEAIYDADNIDRKYTVLMYPGICVVQNINLIPSLNVMGDV